MPGARARSASSFRWRRGRLFAVAVCLVAAIAAVAVWRFSVPAGPDSSDHSAASTSTDAGGSARPALASTSGSTTLTLGPNGIRSSLVIAENARAGSPDWQISSPPGAGLIEGWADHVAAQVGDGVRLYVSTTASTFHVTAYRLGYYGGAGARAVWSSDEVQGQQQAACPVTPGVNMVSCDAWTPSLSMSVTADFMQGDYVLKLVGAGGQQSYIPLTVWDASAKGTYLFETHSLTAQGWNTYGGFDFYAGTGPCAPSEPKYPQCNRARVVSFDRPYVDGHGTGDFLYNEYPLLEWMEQQGLDVDYVSDVTLDSHPEVMSQHKAILSLGHDETWTYAERKGAQQAVDHGVNLAFLSAAAMVRHARLQASPIGPARQEVNYRNPSEDPLNGTGDPHQVTGNTWESSPGAWPTLPLIGQAYMGYLNLDAPSADFVVQDASSWIYKGTGLHNGSVVPGIIGSDFDHLASKGTPADLQVLGHSPIPVSRGFTGGLTWNGTTYSDMTYYTRPDSQAGIFDTGMVSWIAHLNPCATGTTCAATQVQQMTGNLLRLFGQGPAGRIAPSVSNQALVQPAGS